MEATTPSPDGVEDASAQPAASAPGSQRPVATNRGLPDLDQVMARRTKGGPKGPPAPASAPLATTEAEEDELEEEETPQSQPPTASQGSQSGDGDGSGAAKNPGGRGHTAVNHHDSADGFLTVWAAPKLEKRFADCVTVINANAVGGRALAERVHQLEQGSGAGQDDRCIREQGVLQRRIEDLTREVRSLQRGTGASPPGLDDALSEVTTDIEALKEYSAKLAGLLGSLSSSLAEREDEISELRAECDALRARRGLQATLSALPPLPHVGPSSAPPRAGARARSPSSQPGPSNRPGKRTRVHPPLYAVTIGPSPAFAKSKRLYQDVVRILDTLQNAFQRGAPYAVELSKSNAGFVVVFFEHDSARKLVVDNWPSANKDHKNLLLQTLEGVAPSDDAATASAANAQGSGTTRKR